jgi:D-psicose/D-tagatose/L-ribulose 3-epimerase
MRMMNKIGMFFAYWEKEWGADPIPYIQKAAKLGFDVVELSAGGMIEFTDSQLAAIKEAGEDCGIEITYCIGFPLGNDVASADRMQREKGIAYAKRILHAIHKLDGKLLTGILYAAWPYTPDFGLTDKREALDRSIQSVRSFMPLAEDFDITCGFEVVNRFEGYLLNTAAEGVEFVKQIDSENAKLLLDTFHMNIEEDSLTDAIVTAGERLAHFHVGEANRRPPGQGRLPWDDIAGALSSIGYRGRILMEPFIKMGGSVGRDIKVWRDLSGEATAEDMDRMAKESLQFMRATFSRAQSKGGNATCR